MAEDVSFSSQNKLLVDTAERAVRTGRELFSWWKAREAAGDLRKFSLLSKEQPSVGMLGFYDEIELGGKKTSVMGCLQRARFKRGQTITTEAEAMEAFCMTRFMRVCRTKHPDGLAGGFGYRGVLHKLRDSGEYGPIEEVAEGPILDLGEIGKRYEWALLRIDIYDFYRSLPGMGKFAKFISKFMREAMYVAVHQDYFSGAQSPVEGAVAEYRFGYTVLPYNLEPTILGYGPGRLSAAVKQFRFILLENGDLEIQINFVASPRSQKILFLFGGFDPGYRLVRLLNAITLNLLKLDQRAHDKVDAFILAQHGRVHHNLIDSLRQIWEGQNWIAMTRADAAVQQQRRQ